MSIKIILAVFCLVVVFASPALGRSKYIDILKWKRFGLTDNRTLSFLQDHNCRVMRRPMYNHRGFAHYSHATLICDDASPETYGTVTCKERCRDPVHPARHYPRSQYAVRFDFRDVIFEGRDGSKHVLTIPNSCQCVRNPEANRTTRRRH